MKQIKKLSIIAVVAILALSTIMLCACNFGNDNNDATIPTPKTYTIQYTDDIGVHTITVSTGDVYSLDSIPTRFGYEFTGLYDAETGGTQYVTSNGSSVGAFTDNRNIVLYPQFKAKEYTIVLNYGEAAVTGVRSMKVGYGQELSELPTNLQVANKAFKGWYTEPNGEGTQIADAYGLIPSKAKVNENNFDLSDPDGYVNLYAAFKGQEFLVTFYIEGVREPEEQMIEYGTHVSKIVTETRNAEGKAVITWSKSSDRQEVFDGRITGETVLYSMEFAPVIDFDSNGGKAVTSIIAKQGSAISLPTPEKENYKFVGWYTSGGQQYNSTVMQADSVKLIAHWQAKLIFNTNGGTAVDDISEPVGTRVQLPTTEKDGYMFAGWYTEQGQEYTATSMPEFSVKLTAKYHKVEKKKYVLIEATNIQGSYKTPITPTIGSDSNGAYHQIDLSDLYSKGIRNITVTAHYIVWYSWGGYWDDPASATASMDWYNQSTASDAYRVWQYSESFKRNDTNRQIKTHTTTIALTSSSLHVCRYQTKCGTNSYSNTHANWTDFWVEVEYPDMSRLY